MPLNLYRRHSASCQAHHPNDYRSGEFEERKKGWKRCDCLIFASGTLSGRFARKATGRNDWTDSKAVALIWEQANSWEPPAPQPPPDTPAAPPRVTIEEAVRVYLANREATVAHPTFRKYKTFTKQLRAYAGHRGYVCLDQFTPADIDMYFTSSTLNPLSKAKMLEWLRSFWRFAVHRDWVTKSPVSPDLKPPTGATRGVNKLPYTDEQLADIIKACDHITAFGSGRWGNRFGTGVWTGEDLKDFIWLMVYTGLRISDVVLFDIERLRGTEVYLRAKKNGGEVFTVIPKWLADRLQLRAKAHGRRPFFIGGTERLDTVIDTWRQRLVKVFEHADVGEEKGTAHRFRHTFARMLLERGVPVADVADLLGDTESVVRRHYGRWVPERQARLTRILERAFEGRDALAAFER